MRMPPVARLALCALALSFACGPEDAQLHDDTLVAPNQPQGQRSPFVTRPTQLVYVNFNGQRVEDCGSYCSDAQNNRSWAIDEVWGVPAVDFAPYTKSSAIPTILGVLRDAYDGYNVSFTTTRPAQAPYSMIIISPTTGPHHGVAPLNCNNTNPNDIAFVYSIGSSSASWIGRAAAHELGHTFGLAHVTSSSDVMQWASSGYRFTTSTYDTGHVSGKCFDGNTQDAPALLRAALGEPPFDGAFADDDGNTHEKSIDAIYAAGITKGCGGTADRPRFCPNDPVTRGQMAAFLVRALKLPASSTDYFTDDNGHWYEHDANALAQSGITKGCGPDKFCGNDPVTRGQMAAFLDRAFHYPATSTDYFWDDNGTFYEPHANRLAQAKITLGCGGGKYCGSRTLTRAEMATFLARALHLL